MRKTITPLLTLVALIAIALAVMMAGRVAYFAENYATFANTLSDNDMASLLSGSLRFDISAVMYLNIVVVVALLLLPASRQRITLWLFAIMNGAGLAMNLADSVYYKYTGHRTTMSVFSEFSHDDNIYKVFGAETVSHWYLFAVFAAVMVMTILAARLAIRRHASQYARLGTRLLTLIIFIPLCIFGMRGGIGRAVRPITVSNANQYVSRPHDAALVLNTPFSMLRTMGKSVFHDPRYYTDAELAGIYSPLHEPETLAEDSVRRKNVCIIIVESLGREYVGALNEHLDGGRYKGFTPFVDSLSRHSLTFDISLANGRKSIDAMPSILSGIPQFIEPFFLTPAAMNRVGGMARSLAADGYTTAFFHGASNGSMGFEAFAKASGFGAYYGRTEYDADKRFGGEKDFDGTWAIWDEEFMQYYAAAMGSLRQPFMTTVFTASSHHPYSLPEKYRDVYKDTPNPQAEGIVRKENPIHKCVRYTDMALRRFFETASREPWYSNTIFVITADHTNLYDHDIYGTDLGLFSSTLLFFDPSGEMPRGRSHVIAQQTDIMPTILAWLGHRRPFVAWGKDLLSTAAEDSWAVNYNNGLYQYVTPRWLIQHDGQQLKAVYDYDKDPLLRKNIMQEVNVETDVRRLKGIIQSYMQRMTNDQLVADGDTREATPSRGGQ